MQKWLAARPAAATLTGLQAQPGQFTSYYNTRRPHRSLAHRATPAAAYAARPKAIPGDRAADTHHRARADRVDATGKVTLRHGGRLYHIGIGRAHARTRILLLIQDLDVRIINAATRQLLRELTLDPTRNYQPTGRPPGPTKPTPQTQTPRTQTWVRDVLDVLRHHTGRAMASDGIRTHDIQDHNNVARQQKRREPLLFRDS